MRLKYMYYRLRQIVLSCAMIVIHPRDPRLLHGPDSLYQLPQLLAKKKLLRIELITTAGFVTRGTLYLLLEELAQKNIHVTVFSKVKPDPTTAMAQEAARIYRNNHCQALVAIGGGSVIDCAKMVGIRLVKPHKSLEKLAGILKVMRPIPLLIAIPTTAGTGTEASATTVITDDHTHLKFPINDLFLTPNIAILDPKLTTSLSVEQTFMTGMDALSHCVEAYTNRFVSPKARRYALKAIGLICTNLPVAIENGNDIQARENMLLGAYYAGVAFKNAYVGYIHALAHAIGGIYGLPHGRAIATIMPVVLESYSAPVEKKLAQLARHIGLQGGSDHELSMAFITYLRDFNGKMGIPANFAMLKDADFKAIIKSTLHEANPGYPVPVIWDERDIERVLKKLQSKLSLSSGQRR